MLTASKLIAATLILTISISAIGADLMPIGGIHYDNISNANLRAGAAYLVDRVEDTIDVDGKSHEHFIHSNYLFAELLGSEDTRAVSVGWGRLVGEGNYRVGASFIDDETETLRGIEGSFSAFFYTLKAGIYNGSESDETRCLLSIGIGW